jgi:hypothetical protein
MRRRDFLGTGAAPLVGGRALDRIVMVTTMGN